ncbi:zinc finger, C3HC4 type [Trichinella nativa]|uniref:Zinc finger, C3HC4 type n=1 Tax=Trichinella nativa TaxID=6335 RepID=A0A1Y3EXH6_9BILA|nr:zinc finger, C3HC4 type [Trichinella nativa]
MSLECSICCDIFPKLKQLACLHVFCADCLEKIEQDRCVKCPLCRRETTLNGFGVGDLTSKFGGHLQCSDCDCQVEMTNAIWCKDCATILCQRCLVLSHQRHSVEQVDQLGPVKFSICQLEKFARVHTKLAMIQKRLIREYVQQLGEALERELDDDLTARLTRLKAEKEHLKAAFELNSEKHVEWSGGGGSQDGGGDGCADQEGLTGSWLRPDLKQGQGRFASVLNEVYKMSPTSLRARALLGQLPQTGVIFNPPPVDKAVSLFVENGKFALFSISMNSMRKKPALRAPSAYIGAGLLDEPCDLCVNAHREAIHVTCVHKGLYTFLLNSESDELYLYQPLIQANDQCAGVAYDSVNRFVLTTVLRNFTDWIVQIYDSRHLKLQAEIACPKEPKIANGWYRWITALTKSFVLVSAGDNKTAALWLLHLHRKRWTLLHTQHGATYRKAAFHRPAKVDRSEALLYVPDVHNRLVVTFVLNLDTLTIRKTTEIRTSELTRELAICVAALEGRLVVGNWRTGNVIVADLVKCSSELLTSLGPQQLASLCFVDRNQLLMLCKQKEVIELFDLRCM